MHACLHSTYTQDAYCIYTVHPHYMHTASTLYIYTTCIHTVCLRACVELQMLCTAKWYTLPLLLLFVQSEKFEPYFKGEKRLLPKPSDLKWVVSWQTSAKEAALLGRWKFNFFNCSICVVFLPILFFLCSLIAWACILSFPDPLPSSHHLLYFMVMVEW